MRAREPKAARAWLKLSQAKLAEALCLQQETVARYEVGIDFGGHPNERGVVSSLKIEDLHPSRPDTITVGVGVLHPGTSHIAQGLHRRGNRRCQDHRSDLLRAVSGGRH